MTVKAGYSTPMLHVKEIERSLEFYGRLGFVTVDTDRCTPIGWARMHCEGGAVMFLRNEEGEHPPHKIMLVLYTPDLAGLREQLAAAGESVSPITHPGYNPSGEIGMKDPDGNFIFVEHWGRAEQEAWEERLGGRPRY